MTSLICPRSRRGGWNWSATDFPLAERYRERADPRPGTRAAAWHNTRAHGRRAPGDDRRRRAQGKAGAVESPVQRLEVHARGRTDRRSGRCARRRGGDFSDGHWRGHRARGSGDRVRGIPSGRDRRRRRSKAPGSASPSRGSSSSFTAEESGSRVKSGSGSTFAFTLPLSDRPTRPGCLIVGTFVWVELIRSPETSSLLHTRYPISQAGNANGRYMDLQRSLRRSASLMHDWRQWVDNGLIVVPIADVHANDDLRRMNSAAVVKGCAMPALTRRRART